AVAGRVTQVRVVRAEWAKLSALRSTWYCALIAVILVVGVGALAAGGKPYRVSAAHPAVTAVSTSLFGVLLAQLVLGVLGVLAFSGEYGTGMIRATLAVVPSRLPVLWAKLVVLAGLVLPVALLAALAEFFVATAIQSARGGSAISLADPGVLRTVLGASLYLTVAAVIGLALGALLRRTAVGVSAFAGVFFVAPVVVAQLPHSVGRIAPYLPSSAGGALWGQPLASHPLGPWAGFAVLCGYAVVLTGLAAWRLRRRDA
ncbi:MAG: ABC transporter permease subunit, partial [Streptosporangiaceae bacterium]